METAQGRKERLIFAYNWLRDSRRVALTHVQLWLWPGKLRKLHGAMRCPLHSWELSQRRSHSASLRMR